MKFLFHKFDIATMSFPSSSIYHTHINNLERSTQQIFKAEVWSSPCCAVRPVRAIHFNY